MSDKENQLAERLELARSRAANACELINSLLEQVSEYPGGAECELQEIVINDLGLIDIFTTGAHEELSKALETLQKEQRA